MRLLLNILIQVFWLAVCIVITVIINNQWLVGVTQPWKSILCGIIFVVVVALLTIITNIIKSTKDPDVIAASDLRMDIRRYKQYREWYDEYQRLMQQYGIQSKEANEYFRSIFKKIKNPNEWRRYQEFRFKQSRKEWRHNIWDNIEEDERNTEKHLMEKMK